MPARPQKGLIGPKLSDGTSRECRLVLLVGKSMKRRMRLMAARRGVSIATFGRELLERAMTKDAPAE